MTIHPILTALSWWLMWHPAQHVVAPVEPIRLVSRPCLHVGIRPNSDSLDDVAVTVRVSACVNP